MDINALIPKIGSLLNTTFQAIDTWFEKEEALRQYKPASGGWSIDQILEHIALTNHYFLILIEKGTRKALQNAAKTDLREALTSHVFHAEKLNEIGIHQSFGWVRPAHMEPTGGKLPGEVRVLLKNQLAQCLGFLSQMPNGEGVLHSTTMTVNGLGKINVYEYLFFIGQHGQRHLTQMEKVAAEFNLSK